MNEYLKVAFIVLFIAIAIYITYLLIDDMIDSVKINKIIRNNDKKKKENNPYIPFPNSIEAMAFNKLFEKKYKNFLVWLTIKGESISDFNHYMLELKFLEWESENEKTIVSILTNTNKRLELEIEKLKEENAKFIKGELLETECDCYTCRVNKKISEGTATMNDLTREVPGWALNCNKETENHLIDGMRYAMGNHFGVDFGKDESKLVRSVFQTNLKLPYYGDKRMADIGSLKSAIEGIKDIRFVKQNPFENISIDLSDVFEKSELNKASNGEKSFKKIDKEDLFKPGELNQIIIDCLVEQIVEDEKLIRKLNRNNKSLRNRLKSKNNGKN